MSFRGNFTPQNVPQDILDKVILYDKINIDVLSMGAMVGTGLSDEVAEDKGLIKNHWMWRVLIKDEESGFIGQILFGFNVDLGSTVGSNEAQYAPSINRPFSSESGSVDTHNSQNPGSDGNGSYSDVAQSVVRLPPIKASSDGHDIQQPSEGAPVRGQLDIIVRPRAEPSWSHRFTRSFALNPGTTFDQLLRSMTSRGMEDFRFRKLGTAKLGCRDGISQATTAWIADNLLADPVCQEEPRRHIFELLCWRYSQPSVPDDIYSSSDESGQNRPNIIGFSSSWSPIDRAVWPEGYVHFEDSRLQFKQPLNNNNNNA